MLQLAAEPESNDGQRSEGLFLIATGLLKKIAIGDTLVATSSAACLTIRALLLAGDARGGLRVRAPDLRGLLRVHRRRHRRKARSSSVTSSRRTSTFRTPRRICRSSGDAGTSRCRAGFGTISTFRSAETATAPGSRTETHADADGARRPLARASWNFVIWGALSTAAPSRSTVRGSGAAGAAPSRRRRRGAHPGRAGDVPLRVLRLIFFRAKTFAHATLVLERLGKFTFSAPNLAPKVVVVLVVGMVLTSCRGGGGTS